MVEEIKKIITVDVSNANITVKDFKNNVDKLNSSIKNLDASSADYQDTLDSVENAQKTVSNATKEISDSINKNAGAFTNGLEKMSSSIGRINPAAGTAIAGIKGIIEVLRALKTATLSNPWTAILTVAVGLVALIATNWDKVKNSISGAKKEQIDYNAEIEKTKKKQEEINSEFQREYDLRRAQGEDEISIQQDVVSASREAYLNAQRETTFLLQKLNAKKKITDEDRADLKSLQDYENTLYEVYQNEFNRLKVLQAQKEVREEAQKAAAKEKDLADIEKIREGIELSLLDAKEQELTLLEKTYQKQLELFNKYGKDTTALTEKYEKDKLAIIEKYNQANKEDFTDTEDDKTDIAVDKEIERQEALAKIREEYAFKINILENTVSNEFERTKAVIAANAERLDAEKSFVEEQLRLNELSADERQKYAKELALINSGIARNDRELTAAIASNVGTTAQAYGTAIGDLFNTLASNYEQGTKEYKGFATANATIQMLLGITTAISGAFTTKSGPWDIALAAIQAASIAAAGIANIAKINSTEIGSASTGASTATSASAFRTGYTSSVGATTIANESISGIGSEVVNGVKQQDIYVSVTDINRVQNKVKVTENNSSF